MLYLMVQPRYSIVMYVQCRYSTIKATHKYIKLVMSILCEAMCARLESLLESGHVGELGGSLVNQKYSPIVTLTFCLDSFIC